MKLSEDKIIAYFQPILSADSHTIYAYEVLGRVVDDDGTVNSLGPFFSNADTTDEKALRIDRIVRRNAMKKYVEEKRNECLFINIRLAWLAPYADKPEKLLPTIRWGREFGIAPDRFVIEITEEEFNTREAHIDVITCYKKAGYRIALDDYGKNASNIDRLALLRPDIIKINMDYIHKSEESHHYREYLKSLAAFAETVGIEVLYEGIDTQRQLDICMSSKGRFYQGFLIAPPQASMRGAVVNQPVFSASVENTYKALRSKIINADALKKSLDSKLERFLLENRFCCERVDIDAYLTKLCHELPEVRRIYLCNRRGDQITYNFERHLDDVTFCDYRNKNWAWRGYFHDALEAFIAGRKSCLSTAYLDFTTKKHILTYSYMLADDVFLFVDIDRPAPPSPAQPWPAAER